MRVTFRGRVRLRGRVKTGGRSRTNRTRPAASSSLRAIRRIVRQEVRKGVQMTSRRLNQLRAGVRRDLRMELYSRRFANFIGTAVSDVDENEFRELALQYLNRAVALDTTAGTVSGTLTRVGTDFVAVQETPTTLLLIPFDSVTAIRAI